MAKKKIIVDPKGQWSHPGEMTMIPSGNITMDGVNYPVLGIDNLGNHMMMMPGEHYNFEGSSVLEIPMGYHKMTDGSLMRNKQHGGQVESTGVYSDPRTFKGSEFLLNKQKTKVAPKKTLSAKDKKQQLNELNRQLEERDYAQYVIGIENQKDINKIAGLLDPTGAVDISNLAEQMARGQFNPTDAAGAAGSLMPGSSGLKALKLFLNTAGKAGDVIDVVNEQYEQGGQNMKKPNNKGFNKLPKYVQKHIMENMKQEGGQASGDPVYMNTMDGYIMNMGGMPCYNCGGQYQMGGEHLPEHMFSYFMTGENLPIAQNGGPIIPKQGRKTQQQWVAENLALGYQPVPTAAGSTAPGAYQKFYNPKLYTPSTITPMSGQLVSFTNIANPSDVSGNPFIEYQPPKPQIKAPIKAYVERDPTHKPIEFGPNMDYNPNTGNYTNPYTGENLPMYEKIPAQSTLKQFGGSNLSKFMTNYKLGGAAPQGQSLDEVIQQKNKDFVDYIANNTKAAMFRDEAMNFQKGFAQMGQQYNADKSLMEGQTDYMSGLEDQFKGSAESQFMPDIKSPRFGMQGKFDEWNKLGIDPNLAQYNQDMASRLAETQPKQKKSFDGNKIADFAMAGMQGLNSWFNAYHANKQDQFNRDKMTIENTAGTTYGSRGNYDVNQGNFRPNQMTPSFKKGGQYSMDHKTIADLLAQGYELEFL